MHKKIEDKLNVCFSCIKMKLGVIDWDTEIEFLKSIRQRYLKESIEIDSTFAPAYVTLAEAYITLNKFISNKKEKPFNREKSRSAINKALELDSALGEAYISKGNILGKFDWNWEGMREMLEKGLKIDPNNAYGHMLLSDYDVLNSNFELAIYEFLLAEKRILMIGEFLNEKWWK